LKFYAESNFILELSLLQDQHEACSKILSHAEAGKFSLAIPSFCLSEPYSTLKRRDGDRRSLSDKVSAEIRQLARSQDIAQEVEAHRGLSGLLLRSGEHELTRLKEVVQRIGKSVELLPLDAQTLDAAWGVQSKFGLKVPDAIVLASVLLDLDRIKPNDAVFLNKDIKDFDDPDIVAELKQRGCVLLPTFTGALAKYGLELPPL
jgi:predicted nucleic acid-binding protein